MPRVLMVTYHFPPTQAVAAIRTGRLARWLPRFGLDVDVICASIRHASSGEEIETGEPETPGASIRRVDASFVFGRDPRRVPADGRLLERLWFKVRTYTEWLLRTRDWQWRWGESAAAEMERMIAARRYDIVLIDGPPMTPFAPCVEVASAHGIPVVLDLRDIWTGEEPVSSLFGVMSPGLRRRRWRHAMRDYCVTQADHIFVTSNEAAEVVRAHAEGVRRVAITVVPNAFSDVDPEPSSPNDGWADRPLRLVYTGSLAYGRNDQAKNLVRGMAQVVQSTDLHVELVIAGSEAHGLVELAAAERIEERIEVLGWIDRAEALEMQRNADVLVLLQPRDNVYANVAIPAKLFEYMGRRRNILGMVADTPSEQIITSHDLGVVARDETPESIANALEKLAARVRVRPFLPPPPDTYSEEETMRRMAQELNALLVGKTDAGSTPNRQDAGR